MNSSENADTSGAWAPSRRSLGRPPMLFWRENARSGQAGFRLGQGGTHSSRTLMLTELEGVLGAVPVTGTRSAYADAIIASNCLGKSTAATRRASYQRLTELYALDPTVPLFRVLRVLWEMDPGARPLLAMLASLARDPLFLASAGAVLSMPIGSELQRTPVREAIRELVADRMNPDTLDKVVRNVSSSWSQTGHVTGRMFKVRQRVSATPASAVFALWLGNAAGFHGDELLTTGWMAALDCTSTSARTLATEAKRIGLIDLRTAGDVVELGLDRLDPGLGRK